MLRWRLLLGTLIVASLAGLCWLDAQAREPGLWLLPIALIAAILATGETLRLLGALGMRPMPWVICSANLLIVLSGWASSLERLMSLPKQTAAALDGAAIATAVFALFFSEMYRYRKPGSALANLAGGAFAIVYVGLMLRFAIWLRLLHGMAAMVSWIVVVKMGDTGAYTVGRLFGRHKMAPLISPGKTIEGALGAFLFSCLGSWVVLGWLADGSTPWHGWLFYGLLVGGAGMMGDLAESLLKRDTGVKDSSTWMPGFGGVLDILDSLLLSAPVAWLCWATGLVGK
ncbi:MAG: phosphatidate cytidylyltransferase [Thermoguttaceae bacterium]